MRLMPTRRSERPPIRSRFAPRLGLALGVVAMIAGAIVTDAFGAGMRWATALAGGEGSPGITEVPVPATPAVTSPPSAAPEPSGTEAPGASVGPRVPPTRVPVDVSFVRDPDSVFAHEIRDTWCAPAGIQMTLAVLGLADTSAAVQRRIAGSVGSFETYDDSHNGGWGPTAMAAALAANGAPGYKVRVYGTRAAALTAAARAISRTEAPAILLAWRGAHTWVMTGYRADADPTIFDDAVVSGAYILDPWYPTISRIWGASDPPGTFQDAAEMVRNFLPWKRPEGKYPGRDGKFVVLIPTLGPGVGA